MGHTTRWQDGRRAWERLNGWQKRDPGASPARRDTGEDALKALEEIHLCRSLLEMAEFYAIGTARREGHGWAEIAARLHVDQAYVAERSTDAPGIGF